ncbi:MAG: hypothetical protein P9L99_00825 [Candidatus Lernaella stagnicola]|nr:hypothetical protein [Candidatus Lernaella stagnicola]
MQHWLYTGTTLFLLLGWVVAEFYVRRKSRRGTVVRRLDEQGGLAGWLQGKYLIRTDAGRLVAARALACMQCQGDLRPGRRVGLLRDREGFVIAHSEAIGVTGAHLEAIP